MHSRTPPWTRETSVGVGPTRLATHAFLGCLLAVATAGLPTDASMSLDVAPDPVCCDAETTTPQMSLETVPVAGDAGDDDPGGSSPDRVADYRGGSAARLHTADGSPTVGDVFLLTSSGDPTAGARLYERTPYTHDRGVHPETLASNLTALRAVAILTGTDVDLLELTGAPGGGPSGGITYAIAYLDVVSDGAFTGGLRVAATGRLEAEGHVGSIDHIDAKTAAAHLADADVLFTPTAPTIGVRSTYGARFVGELVRAAETGATLHDPRRLEMFHRWGADRPDGMDIVDVRHLIDVAAYLCGSGSTYACHIVELLEREAVERFARRQAEARSEDKQRRIANG